MYPPIFQLVSQDAACKALIGTSPCRFWPFDQAPGPDQTGYGVPYATHYLVYGTPENTLSCVPDTDHVGIQIDVYGKTASETRSVADAIRNAIEATHNVIASYNGEGKDDPTGLYRVTFTADFWIDR